MTNDTTNDQWAEEWAQITETLNASPVDALPALDDLCERILRAKGHPVTKDTVAGDETEGDEQSEVLGDFLQSRAITRGIAAGVRYGPQSITAAVDGYVRLYAVLTEAG